MTRDMGCCRCRGRPCCGECVSPADCCSPRRLRDHLYTLLLLSGAALGVAAGVGLRAVPPFSQPEMAARALLYLRLPAELLARLVDYLAVPLAFTAVAAGACGLGAGLTGRVAGLGLMYWVTTMVLAGGEGMAAAWTVHAVRGLVGGTGVSGGNDSGDGVGVGERVMMEDGAIGYRAADNMLDEIFDLFRSMLPDHFIKSTFELPDTQVNFDNATLPGTNSSVLLESVLLGARPGLSLLPAVALAGLLGASVSRLPPDRARLLTRLAAALLHTFTLVLRGLSWLYPLAVFLLTAATLVAVQDVLLHLQTLLYLVVGAGVALLVHALLLLPALHAIATRRNPYRHLANCTRPLLTALLTNSGNMTLPITMDTLERGGLSPGVVRVTCPMGAALNRDGSALYGAVVVGYLALIHGDGMASGSIVAAAMTAAVVSCTAGTAWPAPAALTLSLTAAGLPLAATLPLLPLEWIFSPLRTAVDVWGDCVGAAAVAAVADPALVALADTQAQFDFDTEVEDEDDEDDYDEDDEDRPRKKSSSPNSRIAAKYGRGMGGKDRGSDNMKISEV